MPRKRTSARKAATVSDAEDTNGEVPRRINTSNLALSSLIASAIATASASGVSAYQSGASREGIKLEMIQWVSENYVTRETGENRAAALTERMSSGFEDLQRRLDRMEVVISDVPKMSAQLDMLQKERK